MKKCRQRDSSKTEQKLTMCNALVVGLNLIAPTARNNDHLGIFIQEKTKKLQQFGGLKSRENNFNTRA